MRYRLGLDVGIASVGWSVIRLDEIGEPVRIEDLGVRVFNAAENPKDGKSLNLPRREARSVRRRLRRRKYRLKRLSQLFIDYGFLDEEKVSDLFNSNHLSSVWDLRVKGLDHLLTNDELYRVAYHISKRRGFKSNRKSDQKDSDVGAQLSGIQQNVAFLKEKDYRTIGEMFGVDEKFQDKKRNSDNDYSHTVPRSLLMDELQLILTKQQELGNMLVTNQFIEECLKIFSAQRPFASKEMIEKMIGNCTFEPEEKRAPKSTYTFEYFMLLQKVNSIRIRRDGKYETLNHEDREKIIALAYKQKTLRYSTIRRQLKLDESTRFKALTYGKDLKETEKAVFVELKAYHMLAKLFKDADKEALFNSLTPQTLDSIGIALTIYKSDKDITDYLRNETITDDIINVVINGSLSNVGHLSLKAMKNIIPYLEEGMTYDKACEEAGYDFKGQVDKDRSLYLPHIPLDEVRNPVVLRAMTQTRKVINAIIRLYGSPETVHIELAREMSHTIEERRQMEKAMLANRKINEQAIDELEKQFNNYNPTGLDIVKKKLWTEQNGICMYSGRYIDPIRLFEPGYVDVDHIIPYSRSFDDSYNNKVMVLSRENRQKGDRIPYEYFSGDDVKWHEFQERVKSSNLRRKKQFNLLRKSFNEEDQRDFMSRNLNDTRYASRFLKNFIQAHLLFSGEGKYKQKVFTVNGPVTSFMRKRWGLTKVREENDRHHALDATVVALTSPGMIKQVTAFSKYKEVKESVSGRKDNYIIDPYTGEAFHYDEFNETLLERFPYPWERFREEMEIRLYSLNPLDDLKEMGIGSYLNPDYNNEHIRPLFVSRMPQRKFTGQIHKETVRSPRMFEEGYVVERVTLDKIKFDKNGDFDMYGKETDPYTYQAIKNRYLASNNDVKTAFKEPLFKPKKNGDPGPEIKKIKIMNKSNTGVFINDGKGIVDNSRIARIDLFKKDNRHYIIPIYMADVSKGILPNRLITNGKPMSEWPVLDDSYEFLFSLQQNDLVKITLRDRVRFGYFRKGRGDQTCLFLDQHDINDSKNEEKIGVTTALSIEKYVVDVLGNYRKVNKETRRGLA